MSGPEHPSPVPWLVVEAVLLGLARVVPASIALSRDPGDRIARHLDGIRDDAPPTLVRGATADHRVHCGVWIGDGVTATAQARAEVVAFSRQAAGDVLLCEPAVPGCGVGLHMLRAIDPCAAELVTDELGDGPDRTRERRPWEPPARWIVAVTAAWRFGEHAELARDGFVARLDRMTAAQMILAVRRVLARFPNAHELHLLAIDELARRGDEAGARQIWGELAQHAEQAGSIVRRARARLLDRFMHDWGDPTLERAAG